VVYYTDGAGGADGGTIWVYGKYYVFVEIC
jgi:hypothetical protein